MTPLKVSDGSLTPTAADGSTIEVADHGWFTSGFRYVLSVSFGEGTGRLYGVTGEVEMHVLGTGGASFTSTAEGRWTFPDWPLK
jgi:hypothetical protein